MANSDASNDKIRELLVQSLHAWRLEGIVRRADDGSILVSCGGADIRLERAPPQLPFRWMVTAAGRKRGAGSLVGVLRQVRAVLDPGHAGERARIALAPLVPP